MLIVLAGWIIRGKAKAWLLIVLAGWIITGVNQGKVGAWLATCVGWVAGQG